MIHFPTVLSILSYGATPWKRSSRSTRRSAPRNRTVMKLVWRTPWPLSARCVPHQRGRWQGVIDDKHSINVVSPSPPPLPDMGVIEKQHSTDVESPPSPPPPPGGLLRASNRPTLHLFLLLLVLTRGIETKHSIVIGCSPPAPRVCMCIHPESKPCTGLHWFRVLGLDGPPAWQGRWVTENQHSTDGDRCMRSVLGVC